MISGLISRLKDQVVRGERDDERGIALQTIIIMVVLLAIGGAVAAVLLTRAGTETDRLEGETDRWTEVGNETGCDIAGGVWNDVSGSCNEPGTAIHNVNTSHNSYSTCHTTTEGNPTHVHSWADNDGDGDGDPATGETDGTCTP